MYARPNLVKAKLARGEVIFMMESWLRDPRAVELMGDAGFDIFFLEGEHVAHNWEGVENLFRTAESVGMTPLFRSEQCIDGQAPVNQIIKSLKCGAQIILVPHLDTPELARQVVNAVKYPPVGKRGIATCDRSPKVIVPNETTPLDMHKYVEEANNETMIWGIIESPTAVKNIEAILDVEGIDGVAFGHQDYSVAAGLSEDDAQEVLRAREKVRDAAISRGKTMYWLGDTPELIEEQMKHGVRIFLVGVDVISLNTMFRSLARNLKAVTRNKHKGTAL